MTERDLSGRVGLVTGAAGNIGRAVALELVRRGASVALADHPSAAEQLESTAADCRALDERARVRTTRFDVTNETAAAAALDEVTAGLEPATLIVNNAGYQGDFANLLDYDLDDARRVFDVNIVGPLIVLQASARRMRDAGLAGSIVNVASMAAHGAVNMPAYSTSKAALVGLTRAAAKDLAPFAIRVNSVSPGFIGPGVMWDKQVAAQAGVASPYYSDDPDEVVDQMIGQVPLHRYGSLEEVATVVAFLLSGASSYMTGSDLEIAGGAA